MPKQEWLKGVFPALVTPFTKSNEVDEEAFRKLIRHLSKDVSGFVPGGTTGEFVYLSSEERKKIIEIAVDEVDGKKPIIAGTGCSSTRETLELTQYAKDTGAQAALVVVPFYMNPSHKEIYEHFDKLNALKFPIILYNIPQCSGVHMKWWTTEGLAQLENVIGVKDSSGDMPYLMALFEKIKGKVSILCGHDEIGMPALAAGADGLILASANLIPEFWQDIYNSVQKGDLERARRLQAAIQKLVRIVVRTNANQAVKEGLNMMGIRVGDSRRPIMPGGACAREDVEELRSELEKLDKIKPQKIKFELNGKSIESDYPVIDKTPPVIKNFVMKVGEGFAGPPIFEVAHIDLLIGIKDGPVGIAFHSAKSRVICDRPKTLLVPTVTIRTKRQVENVYEHATSGINLAIEESETFNLTHSLTLFDSFLKMKPPINADERGC